jgi:hypothetical protein
MESDCQVIDTVSDSPVLGKLKQEPHGRVLSAVRHPRLSQDDLLRPLAPRNSAQLCVARRQ